MNPFQREVRLLERPFLLGGTFLVGNLLIGYTDLSWTAKAWSGTLLVLLPFLAALLERPRPSPRDQAYGSAAMDGSLPPSWTVWASVLSLCLFFRFFQLTTLSLWPRLDEGITDFVALELSERWHWSFFHTYSQLPPLYQWSLSSFFRLLEPSLLSNWLFPAILSTLACLATYPAARAFFPRSFSWVLCLLVAGGFWPAFIGRFSQPLVLMLLLEVLTLGCLGLCWREDRSKGGLGGPALLGALVGAGFYIYAAWPAFAVMMAGAFLWKVRKGRRWREGAAFLLPLVAVLVPLLVTAVVEGYGSYVQRIKVAGSFDGARQGRVLLAYLGGPLWGSDQGDYGPVKGGFLNPLSASLFLLGLVETCKRLAWGPRTFLLAGTFGTLLPGLLTGTVEFFRIAASLPFHLILVALGLSRLAASVPRPLRTHGLVLLLLSTSLLDAIHLFHWYPQKWSTPGPQWSVNIKSVAHYDAYLKLKEETQRKGPGAVLEEFQPDPFDRTLTVAVYPFDTARNPRYGLSDTRWVAVITNRHYRPFLEKRFPEGSFSLLASPGKAQYGGDLLAIIPLTAGNRPGLEGWFRMDQALQPATSWMMRRKDRELRTKVLEALASAEALVGQDPFLASIFWEKVHVQINLEAAYGDRSLEGIHPSSLGAIEKAVRRGYPAAHLWNEYGTFLAIGGRSSEARAAFRKATQAPLDETPAADNLMRLDARNERP